MTLNWISESFQRVIPHENFSITRDGYKSHGESKRIHRLKSKPVNSSNWFSMEIFIGVRLADDLRIASLSANIPDKDFSIDCSSCQDERILRMELNASQTIWHLDGECWLLGLEFSPEYAPDSNAALMLAPRHVVGLSIADSYRRSIARPSHPDNLVHLFWLLKNWLGASFLLVVYLCDFLLVIIKVIVKVIIMV